ncbi:MAG: aldehyde dehydrogenase family protein [Betaproteobacteria bacterium]|nr:aldehyde dehydrogenase family protein [Betaproteobacteria bacterium]MDH4292700.1 aldehyde dehydrogenase family protein [Betaproteobacteria bacterium]MDH5342002.1 aldehyde dehydrogenase family protein [Betaproteobacteria bacterium]
MSAVETSVTSAAATAVTELVARARKAQATIARYSQAQLDELVTAAGWAIMEPARNKMLAEIAVRDTGLGNVADKINKNHRKTLGLMRDLKGAISTGVLAELPELGITEIARPVGVVAAVVPSTNPGATPANNIINALKCGNAVILSPSPKGFSTSAKLLEFIHAEFARIGAPADLVQTLPHPVTKESSKELMRQADLVVVTGSQANVRAAYSSGTPALGVGAGNVAVIVDESADCEDAAQKIMLSKIFDNATSCSSENSVIIHAAVYDRMLKALTAAGSILLTAEEKATLQQAMFPGGKLSPAVTAQSVKKICAVAGLTRPELVNAKCLLVEETGTGKAAPFSGEKLSPVMAVYKARDFDHAFSTLRAIYDYQGNGHSCGIHTKNNEQIHRLGLEMTVCRVIVNQAHAIANGGSFDNGLPFSLTMGCGTWGGNSFSENLNYKHFMNTTRIVRVIPPREPTPDDIFGAYRKKYGA